MNEIETLTRKERKRARTSPYYRKKNKIKKDVKDNVDHLVARAVGGSEHYCNKRLGPATPHKGKHFFFDNKLFHEQMLHLIEYNYQSLSEAHRDYFAFKVINILEAFLKEEALYNKKCFKNNKPPKTIGK